MSRPPTTSGLPPAPFHLVPAPQPLRTDNDPSLMPQSQKIMFTVGRMDAGLALLLTPDHYLVEFPAILLPDGIQVGAVLAMEIERDGAAEKNRLAKFKALQTQILEEFSTPPTPPKIRFRRATQTSITIEWDPLKIGNADVRGVTVYKNGDKGRFVWIADNVVRLTGLKVDCEYDVHLEVRTSAGPSPSNKIKTKTHKLLDLTGLHVCIIGFSDDVTEELKELVDNMNASYSEEITAENTQLVLGPADFDEDAVEAADKWNIPVVNMEWLKATASQKRIKNASEYYARAS